MDFRLTEGQERYREAVRHWVADNIPEMEALPYPADPTPEQMRERYALWQRKRFDFRLTCVHWPEAVGGAGLTAMEHFIVTEEIDTLNVAPNLNIIGFGMCLPVILHAGSDEQRNRYIPAALRGEEIWCQLFSEPGAGSDLAGLTTRAEPDGKGWRVNGQKTWTSYAHFADRGLCLARSESSASRHRGLTMFLVDMRREGVSVRPIRINNGDHVFNEVFFDNVYVEPEDVLGEVHGGWKVAIDTLMFERGTSNIHILMRPQIDKVIALAKERLAGAAPTLGNQAARGEIARLITRLKVMDIQGLRVLHGATTGAPPGPEGSFVKLDWSEINQRAQALALDLLGPAGALLGDNPAVPEGGWFPKNWLRSFANTIEAGSSEILRNIVSERILGLPKDAQRQNPNRAR